MKIQEGKYYVLWPDTDAYVCVCTQVRANQSCTFYLSVEDDDRLWFSDYPEEIREATATEVVEWKKTLVEYYKNKVDDL